MNMAEKQQEEKKGNAGESSMISPHHRRRRDTEDFEEAVHKRPKVGNNLDNEVESIKPSDEKPRLASFIAAEEALRRSHAEEKEKARKLFIECNLPLDYNRNTPFAHRMDKVHFCHLQLMAEKKELQEITFGVWNHRIMEGFRRWSADRISGPMRKALDDTDNDFNVLVSETLHEVQTYLSSR
jgi:hypothetical protein